MAFADTFYWIALASQRDPFHVQALQFESQLRDGLTITTGEVLVEFMGFVSKAGARARSRSSALIRGILAAENIQVIPQSHDSFLAGLALYEQRPDKGYSLVDCVSMHTMRHLGVSRALTGDRHFEQEGFEVLFAP